MSLSEVLPQPITLDEPPKPKPFLHYALKAQKYTAYGFTVFVGIHFGSVLLAPAIGHETGSQVFEMARAVYHGIPGFESLMVLGCGVGHVISGLVVRYLRPQRKHTPVEQDPRIGLGGITSLVGLGYRKSTVSQLFPSLSPISVSGYLTIPLIAYHFYFFRYLPAAVDGDSSLLTLEYVAMYAKSLANRAMLYGLLVTATYHFVSGWLRFGHKYSAKWKRMGYLSWFGLTAMGVLSVGLQKMPTGFLEKTFRKYLRMY